MKTHLLVLMLVVSARSAFADTDFDQLNASYEAALERATAPIRATYSKELQRLLEKRTKAGDLDAALEVKAVIDKLASSTTTSGSSVSTATTEPDSTTSSHQVVERLFVNKTWSTPTGTKFDFDKNGKGSRQFGQDKTSIVWRFATPDIVEATGQATQGGSMRTWYFRFISRSEAYYGDAKDEIGSALKLE